MQAAVEVIGEKEPTPRQRAVLDAALRLLVEEGDAITMTAVARRANCSKETLYKWFGGRDGLLTATVQWQASKVRVAAVDGQGLDLAALTARLEGFASDWLKVISSDSSIALNRIAVAHAAQNKNKGGKDNLGAIVLENGRFALARRLKPVLEAGRAAGLLDFADAETVFRTFFGLVGRDVQVRLLLGDRPDMSEAAIAHDARQATRQFLTLFGAAKPGPRVRSL